MASVVPVTYTVPENYLTFPFVSNSYHKIRFQAAYEYIYWFPS